MHSAATNNFSNQTNVKGGIVHNDDGLVSGFLRIWNTKYKIMINEIIGIITDTMPKDDNGNIIDKQLHSDLITAIQLAKNLHQPDVSSLVCRNFFPDGGSTAGNICKWCGKQSWQH